MKVNRAIEAIANFKISDLSNLSPSPMFYIVVGIVLLVAGLFLIVYLKDSTKSGREQKLYDKYGLKCFDDVCWKDSNRKKRFGKIVKVYDSNRIEILAGSGKLFSNVSPAKVEKLDKTSVNSRQAKRN